MTNSVKNISKRAMKISEAAEYACVSRGIIESWLNKGLLPYEELPSTGTGSHRFRRIRKQDLDEFLRQYYQTNVKCSDTKQYSLEKVILLPRKA